MTETDLSMSTFTSVQLVLLPSVFCKVTFVKRIAVKRVLQGAVLTVAGKTLTVTAERFHTNFKDQEYRSCRLAMLIVAPIKQRTNREK
jgi:hypothetical protein